MIDWKYNPDDFSEDNYGLIPVGRYRVRIENAQEKVSRSGNEMIELTLAVSGFNSKIWSYQVLDQSDREHERRTNQRLGTIFSSFNIPLGDFNLSTWCGRTGGAYIRHRKDMNGMERAEVGYFLYRKEVDALPDWQEGTADRQSGDKINPDIHDFSSAEEDKIPF